MSRVARRRHLIRFVAGATAMISLPWTPLAGQSPQFECGLLIHVSEASGVAPLPQGDVFCPLVADPKEPRSFVSWQRARSPLQVADSEIVGLAPFDTDIGAIGVGDSFGLLRWGGSRPGDGVQIGVSAGIFAQFDLDTDSYDLINADYLIGVPLTLRRGGFSSRLRLYHQSSHLGDEFLLRDEPERLNLAFQSLELILSQAFGALRVYAGGETLFNRDPDDLDPLLAHAGAELRVGSRGTRSLVAAADVKSSEQQEWKPAWSGRAGFEFGWGRDPEHPPRVLRLLFELYNGPSPYGQFYREQIRYWGFGLHLFP
jgi:hypothetical protein